MTSRRLFVLGCVAVGLLLLRAGADRAGYRLNTTASMPYGIWHVDQPPAMLERGMIVIVCLPSNEIEKMAVARRYIGIGECDTETEPLLKPVVAISGDAVLVTADGISVNGVLIPNSAPKTVDAAKRPLASVPIGKYSVSAGDFWAVSSYPGSFDSRYFGQLPSSSVVGAASPKLVWP